MTPYRTITRFGMMRHAETLWNQEKRIQGQTNTPLTLRGKNQAQVWGRHLKGIPWHRILSSDLGRALETADIVNAHCNVPIVIDAALREQHWGRWTGMTIKQIRNAMPRDWAEQESAGWKFHPPDGENREDVFQRTESALNRAAGKWRGETILVIAHEGVMKCLLYLMLEQNRSFEKCLCIHPYRLHWLIHDGTRLFIEKPNAVHLNPLFADVPALL